ncbi:MAG: zinc protease [Phycisphaerales bacterium]|jgi:zinc protease
MTRDLWTTRLTITTLALLAGTACAYGSQPTVPLAPDRAVADRAVADPAVIDRADTLDVTLKNGMRVIVRRHGEAGGEAGGEVGSGQIAFWLRVEAGSAHERDDERGAAHVGEHLALSGPERGQPGFDDAARLRVAIGKDRNAYTNVNHAAYWIVTDGTAEQNDAAMRTLATVLQPQAPTRATLDRERLVVIGEWNDSDSPEARAQRALLSGLFPGTALDTRWPSVEPEVLARLTPTSVHRFRSRTSVPGRASLVVVGPMDASETAALAAKIFGGLGGGPITVGHEPDGLGDGLGDGVHGGVHGGAIGDRGLRTVRAPVEGWAKTEMTIAWPGQTAGEGLSAQGMAESLAVTVMRDRVKRRVAQTPDWAGSDLIVYDTTLPISIGGDAADRLRLTQVGATFPPAAASRGLSTMALAVAGIVHNPVTDPELAAGIEAVLSRYERAVEREGSSSASQIASRIATRLPGPVRAPAGERLTTAGALLRDLRAARVTDAARSLFDPRRAVLLAQGPPEKLPPSSAMMADLRLALFAAPDADGDPTIGAAGEEPRIFREPPEPVHVRQVSLDDRAGVFDAVLANGVTVRHREMPTPEGEVYLRVAIGEGALPEDAWEQAQAAAEMLAQHPATRASPDEELVWMLERRGLELDAQTEGGSVELILRAPAESLDRGARLLAGLIAEPSVGRIDLDRFRARASAELAQTRAVPALLARSLLEGRLNANDRQIGEPGPASVELDPGAYAERLSEYSADSVCEALSRAAQRGDVVVTVVGACSRDEAVDAVAEAFGALRRDDPPRQERWPTRATQGAQLRVTTTEPCDTAASATAWSIPRKLTVREVRGLVVATSILDERLSRVEGLGAFLQEYRRATIAYDPADPGWASVVVVFTASPGEVESLREQAEGVLRDFAARGPTAQELEKAGARSVSRTQRALGNAWFWSSRLATSELAGQPLEELLRMPTDYASVSAEACRVLVGEALAGGRVVVVASPPER